MAAFKIGDNVRLICHPRPEYCGRVGKIAEVNQGTLGPRTQGILAGGQLPEPGTQAEYSVQVDGLASLLTGLREEWLSDCD